jgi:hypothetical protein
MRADWPGCANGTGQSGALSLSSMMARPVWGALEVVAEGKVVCAQLFPLKNQ